MSTEQKVRQVLESVLRFHSGGHWDHARQNDWVNACADILPDFRAKPRTEATTKVLCDMVRAVLSETDQAFASNHQEESAKRDAFAHYMETARITDSSWTSFEYGWQAALEWQRGRK